MKHFLCAFERNKYSVAFGFDIKLAIGFFDDIILFFYTFYRFKCK